MKTADELLKLIQERTGTLGNLSPEITTAIRHVTLQRDLCAHSLDQMVNNISTAAGWVRLPMASLTKDAQTTLEFVRGLDAAVAAMNSYEGLTEPSVSEPVHATPFIEVSARDEGWGNERRTVATFPHSDQPSQRRALSLARLVAAVIPFRHS